MRAVTRAGDDAERAPAAFTRDELDAAEPVQPPSTRRRWLIGLGIGALTSGLAWPFGILNPAVLIALTAVASAGGAGTLVGAGAAPVLLLLLLAPDALAGEPFWALLAASNVATLAIGLLATAVVVGRRSERRP